MITLPICIPQSGNKIEESEYGEICNSVCELIEMGKTCTRRVRQADEVNSDVGRWKRDSKMDRQGRKQTEGAGMNM